ncbi:hypothetical protein BDW60DRAFT_52218 [Aspergillus nidulans var. acristatus]
MRKAQSPDYRPRAWTAASICLSAELLAELASKARLGKELTVIGPHRIAVEPRGFPKFSLTPLQYTAGPRC